MHFKKYLQVASTRLTNRHQRPNIELCRDEPAHRLIEEVTELETTVQQLENKVGGWDFAKFHGARKRPLLGPFPI